MNITIVQTFTDGFTTYQSGQELSVPSEVAQRWIADGTAQADTDGQQSWLSSTEVAATRALVSEGGDLSALTAPGLLSGVVYDASNRAVQWTIDGVTYTGNYGGAAINVAGSDGTITNISVDPAQRITSVATA